MPPGTVITRFRLRPGVVSTTYAVITLVIEPIGRSSTDDRDQRSAPFAAFANSAHRDRTPAGPAPVRTAALAAGATMPPATMIPASTAATARRTAIRIGTSSRRGRMHRHSFSAASVQPPLAIEFPNGCRLRLKGPHLLIMAVVGNRYPGTGRQRPATSITVWPARDARK